MHFVVNLRNKLNNFKFDLKRVNIIKVVQKLKTLLSIIDEKIKDKDI
jgi:hypothetical protein